VVELNLLNKKSPKDIQSPYPHLLDSTFLLNILDIDQHKPLLCSRSLLGIKYKFLLKLPLQPLKKSWEDRESLVELNLLLYNKFPFSISV